LVAYTSFYHGRKPKKQSFKSTGNTAGLPSDLTGIVHAVIQKIHTDGASSSSATPLQLKSCLPTFYNLNRSVDTALSAGNANCCLTAHCSYVSSSSSSQCKTAAERNVQADSADLSDSEQSHDTADARHADRILRTDRKNNHITPTDAKHADKT